MQNNIFKKTVCLFIVFAFTHVHAAMSNDPTGNDPIEATETVHAQRPNLLWDEFYQSTDKKLSNKIEKALEKAHLEQEKEIKNKVILTKNISINSTKVSPIQAKFSTDNSIFLHNHEDKLLEYNISRDIVRQAKIALSIVRMEVGSSLYNEKLKQLISGFLKITGYKFYPKDLVEFISQFYNIKIILLMGYNGRTLMYDPMLNQVVKNLQYKDFQYICTSPDGMRLAAVDKSS